MKNLNIQLSIVSDDNTQIKSLIIPLEDYIDMKISKKSQNIADDILSNMLRTIINEKQTQNS
jgi:hypothetical protein